MDAMSLVRRTFLLFGMISFLGGVAQVTGPWACLEGHIRQTLAIANTPPAIRVNLGESYALLMRAGVMGVR
jgi:hypothetical protein